MVRVNVSDYIQKHKTDFYSNILAHEKDELFRARKIKSLSGKPEYPKEK